MAAAGWLRQSRGMDLDSLWSALGPPWRAGGLALAAALGWAGACRLLRRRELGALGAGIGIAAGWWLLLGLPAASPRQILERLPMLAVAGAAAGLLLAVVAGSARGMAAAVLAAAGLLAGAWWLGGMPLAPADLRRAAVTLLALAVLMLGLALALRGAWQAMAAGAVLAGGLWIAAPPGGPWLALAACLPAAALGAAVAGPAWGGAAARLPMALALGAVAAAPVLGRGAAADWAAAAAPVAALWLGPALAGQLRGRAAPVLGWGLASGLPLVFAWLLARGP